MSMNGKRMNNKGSLLPVLDCVFLAGFLGFSSGWGLMSSGQGSSRHPEDEIII